MSKPQSAWDLPLVEVIDELGGLIVDCNHAFDLAAATLGGMRIGLYDALKATEKICGIKNVPLDDLLCREDGCLVIPERQREISHSMFLRVVLQFSRGRDKYETNLDVVNPEEQSDVGEFKKKPPLPVDYAARDVRLGTTSAPSSPRGSPRAVSPRSPRGAGNKQNVRITMRTEEEEAELDRLRRARIRKLEGDILSRAPITAIAAPRSPRSSLPPMPASESKKTETLRIVARDRFPTFAEETEPTLAFINLSWWERFATYTKVFAPKTSDEGKGQEREHLRRLLAKCFAEEDVDCIYHEPGAKRVTADLSIKRSDFGQVMSNPRLKLVTRVSSGTLWTPTRSWWDRKLVEVSSVSTKPGMVLTWKDFCVALNILTDHAKLTANRFRRLLAGEIWSNISAKAVALASRKIKIREAEEAAMELELARRRREARRRETEQRRLADLEQRRAQEAAEREALRSPPKKPAAARLEPLEIPPPEEEPALSNADSKAEVEVDKALIDAADELAAAEAKGEGEGEGEREEIRGEALDDLINAGIDEEEEVVRRSSSRKAVSFDPPQEDSKGDAVGQTPKEKEREKEGISEAKSSSTRTAPAPRQADSK